MKKYTFIILMFCVSGCCTKKEKPKCNCGDMQAPRESYTVKYTFENLNKTNYSSCSGSIETNFYEHIIYPNKEHNVIFQIYNIDTKRYYYSAREPKVSHGGNMLEFYEIDKKELTKLHNVPTKIDIISCDIKCIDETKKMTVILEYKEWSNKRKLCPIHKHDFWNGVGK
jgi:hypothetical protein